MDLKLTDIKENAKVRSEQADKDIAAARTEMEHFQVYLAEKRDHVQKSMISNPATIPGAVPMQIAPGGILHSSMIDTKVLQDMVKAEGVEDQHNATFIKLFVKSMATIMTPVEAPAAGSQAASGQQISTAESSSTITHQNDLTLDNGQVELVMEGAEQLTDDDTDTEEETNAANGDKKKKAKPKISKADKKKKAAAAKAKAADTKLVGNVD